MRGMLMAVAALGMIGGQAEAQQRTTTSTTTRVTTPMPGGGSVTRSTTTRTAPPAQPSRAGALATGAVVGGAVVGGAVVGNALMGRPASGQAAGTAAPVALNPIAPAPGTAPVGPAHTARDAVPQARLVSIVQETGSAYAAPGATDVAKLAAARSRADRICAQVPAAVENWEGELTVLRRVADGIAMEVRLAPGLTIASAPTMAVHPGFIPASSQLLTQVAPLRTGQPVRFSGRFVAQGTATCFRSLVTEGEAAEMRDPRFLFLFERVEAK